MPLSELKDMIPQKLERMHTVEDPKRQQLVQATYEVVGCLHEVYRQLGPGLPEYIYQEALAKLFTSKGIPFKKELEFHPLFMGEPLEAYLKMDMVVELPTGNIIIECKALTQLTEREHYQTFGYLRATQWSIAILVNFGADHRAQIERYHYTNGAIQVF